jgi:hypothetical protein
MRSDACQNHPAFALAVLIAIKGRAAKDKRITNNRRDDQ